MRKDLVICSLLMFLIYPSPAAKRRRGSNQQGVWR
jgi:hypothetical protein